MQHDKRPKGWNHTNRRATSDESCTSLHHIGMKTKNAVKLWPYWSWLLKCGGAGPQVQGQQQWELLTPASPHWDEVLQLHSLTAARTWATLDPNSAGQPQTSLERIVHFKSFICQRFTLGCSQRVQGALPIMETATPWADQLRGPEWQHTGTKWGVGEPKRDVPTGTTQDSDINLLLSTCVLHLPLAPKRKREANADLNTFFTKVGIRGNLCRQTGSVVVPQGASSSARSSPRLSASSLLQLTPTVERGTAPRESLPPWVTPSCSQQKVQATGKQPETAPSLPTCILQNFSA